MIYFQPRQYVFCKRCSYFFSVIGSKNFTSIAYSHFQSDEQLLLKFYKNQRRIQSIHKVLSENKLVCYNLPYRDLNNFPKVSSKIFSVSLNSYNHLPYLYSAFQVYISKPSFLNQKVAWIKDSPKNFRQTRINFSAKFILRRNFRPQFLYVYLSVFDDRDLITAYVFQINQHQDRVARNMLRKLFSV